MRGLYIIIFEQTLFFGCVDDRHGAHIWLQKM